MICELQVLNSKLCILFQVIQDRILFLFGKDQFSFSFEQLLLGINDRHLYCRNKPNLVFSLKSMNVFILGKSKFFYGEDMREKSLFSSIV